MSYYRRGYSWENIEYIPAPTGGWNPDNNPWDMPQGQAPVLDNMLVRSGNVSGRRPIGKLGAVSGFQNPFTCAGGVACVYETLLAYATTAGVPAARIPFHYNQGAREVISSNIIIARTNAAGSIVSQAATIDQAPGFRWINFDGLMYGIGAGSSGATVPDVNGNYAMPPLKLLTMNPSLVLSTTVPTVHALAPQGALDLLGYQSRIWLLGGVDTPGAGTTHSSTTLFFTNPGASGVGGATSDWQDPVSGLTNQIVMDRNTQDAGVGLARVRGGLLILRKHSVWLLRGTTTSNYTLQIVSPEGGCIDARSIVETKDGVYFLGNRGMMFTDGVRVVEAGGSAQQTIRDAIDAVTKAANVGNEALQMNLLSTGHILVSIIDHAGGSSWLANQPVWSGVFDTTTKTWSRFTSKLFSIASSNLNNLGYPVVLIQNKGNDKLHCIDDINFYVLEDSNPQGVLGWSFTDTYSPVQNVNGSFWEMDLATFQPMSTAPIPYRWDTHLLPIVGTTTQMRKYGQGKRWFLDYIFQETPQNGQNTPTGGWVVQPTDSTYTALGSPVTAPLATPALPGLNATFSSSVAFASQFQNPIIQRVSSDFTREVSDMFFSITSTSSFPAPSGTLLPGNCSAELYGIGIEYQPGRDLR